METKISVKMIRGVEATNAYTVTVTDEYKTASYDVHTDSNGRGLWVDGRLVAGTLQFSAGKNPAAAIRRYFASI